MIGALRTIADFVLGRGEATITVPTFNRQLKPNQILETAEIVAHFDAPEDLATDGTSLFLADGCSVLRLEGTDASEVRRFDRPITALCCLPGGGIAVALAGREVQVFEKPATSNNVAIFTDPSLNAINTLSPGPGGTLVATDGSITETYARWVYDLMGRGRTGRVLSLDPATAEIRTIVSGLRYAFGACMSGETLLVSESWRHRVLAVAPDGSQSSVLDDLPVYPSRLSPASSGGFWLTVFAARTQLVEFVLRENAYRRRMMKEINSEYWIAPRLSCGHSFIEPMQGGHIKIMEVVKPWAPTRSYGLVIRLKPKSTPLYSMHNRFDGTNHGVICAIEFSGSLFVLAKGTVRVIRVRAQRSYDGIVEW